MNAQNILDVIIKPTLVEMQCNTIDARMLLLATYTMDRFELESSDIIYVARHWNKWSKMTEVVRKVSSIYEYGVTLDLECEVNKRLACLIAYGKYDMDNKRMPGFDDKRGLYEYYKRVYVSGDAPNFTKWCEVWKEFKLDEVEL